MQNGTGTVVVFTAAGATSLLLSTAVVSREEESIDVENVSAINKSNDGRGKLTGFNRGLFMTGLLLYSERLSLHFYK